MDMCDSMQVCLLAPRFGILRGEGCNWGAKIVVPTLAPPRCCREPRTLHQSASDQRGGAFFIPWLVPQRPWTMDHGPTSWPMDQLGP